jgi:hypothetical protein
MGFFGKLFKAAKILLFPVTFGVALAATGFMITSLAFFEGLNAVEAKVYRRSTSRDVYFNPAIDACVKGLKHGLKSVWTDFGIYAPLEISEALFSPTTREPFYQSIEGNSQSLDTITQNSKLLVAAGKNKEAMYEALIQPDSLESRTKIVELLEDSLNKSPNNKDKILPLLEQAKERKSEFTSEEVVNPMVQKVKKTTETVSKTIVDSKEDLTNVVKKPEEAMPNRSDVVNNSAPLSSGVKANNHSQLLYSPELENNKGSANSVGGA